jgi:hypothetical protein
MTQGNNLKAIIPTVLAQFDRWNSLIPTYKYAHWPHHFATLAFVFIHCSICTNIFIGTIHILRARPNRNSPYLILFPTFHIRRPNTCTADQTQQLAARGHAAAPAAAHQRAHHAPALHQADARAPAAFRTLLFDDARLAAGRVRALPDEPHARGF